MCNRHATDRDTHRPTPARHGIYGDSISRVSVPCSCNRISISYMEVASRVETIKVFALGGVAVLMVPVFFLSVADPMAPPSPELAARLASELS